MNDDYASIWTRLAAAHQSTPEEIREEIRLALADSTNPSLSPEEAVSLAALCAIVRLCA